CTNSPFSPTTTSLSGNCTLESNPERHDKAPLAVAIGSSECERCIESS
ncbi:replication initiation protein, partial [Salmonella enterica subsp. enterica serovar Hadar]